MSAAICPHCHKRINYKPALAGKVVNCPGCRGQFQLPAQGTGASHPIPPAPPQGVEPADPWAFDREGDEEPRPRSQKARRSRNKLVGATIGGVILAVALGLGFLWLRGDLFRLTRPTVSEFENAAERLNKPGAGGRHDRADTQGIDLHGYYRVNKAHFFDAVGRPARQVEVGGKTFWSWDCRDGTVEIDVFDDLGEDLRFEIVSTTR